MATGTGGGYGDPFQRPEEAVVQDVRDGYVTPEMAERDYAIVVDMQTWTARNIRTRSKNDRQTSAMPARTDGIRPGDRTDAVLGILRGETSASAVALRFRVDKAEVERWVQQFLAGGEGAMRGTSQASGDGEIHELRSMVRELADELASLRRSLKN
jgi:hypothetical protein